MGAFGDAISNCNLMEVPFTSSVCTWSHGLGINLILKRLDRSLANSYWCSSFPSANESMLNHHHYNHYPLLNTTAKPCVKLYGTRPFRYENHWVKYDNCKDVVRQEWSIGTVIDVVGLS